MWNQPALGGLKTLISVMVLLVCATPASSKARGDEVNRAQALAEIATGVVTCSAHPCLGDSEEEVRKQLDNKIVSDGVFYFSELTKAFPPARNVLSGLVEWEFDPSLETVSLKITDFQAEAPDFLAELERLLPGCLMDRDDDLDEDSPGNGDESAEDATREWSCSTEGHGKDDILVEVYFVPGLLILEIGP